MQRLCRCVAAATFVLTAATTVAAQRPQAAPSKNPAPAATLINLNTATASQLESLPGIGAKTALRIIDQRQKSGGFKKIEELMNVRGIGEKSFLKLKPLITVGPAKTDVGRQTARP